jgi:hypothetical protein
MTIKTLIFFVAVGLIACQAEDTAHKTQTLPLQQSKGFVGDSQICDTATGSVSFVTGVADDVCESIDSMYENAKYTCTHIMQGEIAYTMPVGSCDSDQAGHADQLITYCNCPGLYETESPLVDFGAMFGLPDDACYPEGTWQNLSVIACGAAPAISFPGPECVHTTSSGLEIEGLSYYFAACDWFDVYPLASK